MTRLAGVLAVVTLVASSGAEAAEARHWPGGPDIATIDRDPWRDGVAPPVHDDAFVFSDVAAGQALTPDSAEIAIRFDVELLSRPQTEASEPGAAGSGARVAWSFDRFVTIGADGRAYASRELARGRSGPTSLAESPGPAIAVVAMATDR